MLLCPEPPLGLKLVESEPIQDPHINPIRGRDSDPNYQHDQIPFSPWTQQDYKGMEELELELELELIRINLFPLLQWLFLTYMLPHLDTECWSNE